jgi:hypothetical protein
MKPKHFYLAPTQSEASDYALSVLAKSGLDGVVDMVCKRKDLDFNWVCVYMTASTGEQIMFNVWYEGDSLEGSGTVRQRRGRSGSNYHVFTQVKV